MDRHAQLAQADHVTYELSATEDGRRWTTLTSQRVELRTPERLVLHRPWPNPFNPRVHVAFSLDVTAHVDLGVFDVAGRRVATLRDGRFPAGRHESIWNGEDEQGQPVASGVYYVLLRADGQARGREKLVLTK